MNVPSPATTRTRSGRLYVWAAVIIGSRFPEVICRQFGWDGGLWVSPLSETLVVLGLAIVVNKLCSEKDLIGFVLVIAVLSFSWGVVVPWIDSPEIFQVTSRKMDWGAGFFFLRAIRAIGVLFLLPVLVH